MADNLTVTAGTGTTIGADEIAAVKYQRIKMILGADGTNDGDVSSANPMPVTGTVTANLGATDNAVLDAIAASDASIDSKITACNTGAVVVSSSALPSGASTAANQSTIIGHVDGLETTLTALNNKLVTGTVIGDVNLGATDNAVLDSIAAKDFATQTTLAALNTKVTACNTGAVVLAAGTANIGDVDVLSLPAIPAGTNNIGDVDIASIAAGDNNIGNVDVVTLPAVTGAVTANPSKLATTDDADFMRKYYTSTGAATDGVIWSPAAGKRWYVTDLIINTSAAATITLEDDLTAGDAVVMKFELAANGGTVINFKTPLASGEDAADLMVTTSAGNIYITAVGYEV